jgi:hypothetical protein
MSKKKRANIGSIPSNYVGLAGSHFLRTGFIDYVGARVMLNNDLPLQGVVLASTCIEKYLKAILASVGKKIFSHLDDENLLTAMSSNGVDVTSYISHSFLKYLGRAYQFRYIEPHTGPVSIGVERRKLLAELDYTVNQFESALTTHDSKGLIRESPYKIAVAAKDQRIFLNNYVLNGIEKTDFVEQPALLYGAFAAPMYDFLEITHPGFRSTNNALFDYPTVTVVAHGKSIKLEFGENVEKRFIDPFI